MSVVGIGASAGGLEAVTMLLTHLPVDTGMAYVLFQHLDPSHPSMLPEILPRSTRMPVVEGKNGMAIEANHVYVVPPNVHAAVANGRFVLSPRPKTSADLPIDQFFRSLAEAFQSRAIGIILSGTLSDGALGLKAIQAHGGLTFAQDEKTAKFPDMPRAAVAAGSVDAVLPPHEIARWLAVMGRDPSAAGRTVARKSLEALSVQDPAVAAVDESRLAQVLRLLRKHAGVDFSSYRPTTVRRRIARRMSLVRMERLDDYVRLVRSDSKELDALYHDILISVTSFFRDPQSYEALKSRVLPALLKNRSADSPIRIWVPGCSTGEEAYSIAIVLFEYIEETGRSPTVQIFATDVSEAVIEKARTGTYPESALADVSPDRLNQFFVRGDGVYQVSKRIRDVCVFARQNVTVDPPFSNLDLISCRNLLIYLEPFLQKRIVPLFHYALKPKGYLMLGSAETLGTFADLFEPVDRKHRIFAKRPGASRPPIDLGSGFHAERALDASVTSADAERPALELQKEADRLLLERYAPPGVVVNDALEIVQFRGRTSAYLESAPGSPSLNLLKMAKEGLLADIRSAVTKARRTRRPIRLDNVSLREEGSARNVTVQVTPLKRPGTGDHYLILFEEESARAAPPREKKVRRTARDQNVAKLEQELTATREYLQAIIEEQEAANEELKSANEEILSSNEELQSTNEELETAKDELQSTNEELTTVNDEMQNRNAEILRINSDFVNLLSSIDTPIVMLGLHGEVRRFTKAAEKLLSLIPADAGRPLGDRRANIDLPDVHEFVAKVTEGVPPIEREVRDRAGNWYSLRIRPYRTLDNRIDGAVLVFVDIDPLKRTIEQAQRSRDYAEALVDTMREALIVLDRDLKIRTANRSFYERFQISPINVEGKSLFEIGGDWGEALPALRTRLENAVEKREHVRDYEFTVDFPHLGRKTLVASARPVRLATDPDTLVLLAVEDVTEARRASTELRASDTRYRRLFEMAREAIWLLDGATGQVLDVNPFATELFGFGRNELVGRRPWDLPLYADPEGAKKRFRETVRAGQGFAPDVAMRTRDGRQIRIEKVSSVHSGADGTVVQSNMRDLTERMRLEEDFRQSQKMESIGRLAGGIAHDFNNILNIISAYSSLLAKGVEAKKRAQSTEAIETAVQRGAALVRQLLTFARRETTRFEPVDVNTIIGELASMLAETFPKSIRISLDLESGLPRIEADPNQIHQALLNLAVNARDAMPEGGTLQIATAVADGRVLRKRFPDAAAERYVCVGVSDEGEGMDEATRNRIFEPFFTTKSKEAGSGLGLAVVHGVANSHGGYVDLQSEPGKGSRFSIYLPIRSAEHEHSAPRRDETASSERGDNETILVVEDEELLRKSMTSLIESEGYRVLAAKDGVEAVRLYERHRSEVAVVLAALWLPRMGGWEAFLEMRKINPAVRAVFTSGSIDNPQRAEMRRAGVALSIRKPFTATEILGAIRKALRPAAH